MKSSDESDSLDDEYDNDRSDSRSAGTCDFPFLFEDSFGSVDGYFGRVCCVDSGFFSNRN